jgi:hypothetical protein
MRSGSTASTEVQHVGPSAFRQQRPSVCGNCILGSHFNNCLAPATCGCVCNEEETRVEYRNVMRQRPPRLHSAGNPLPRSK